MDTKQLVGTTNDASYDGGEIAQEIVASETLSKPKTCTNDQVTDDGYSEIIADEKIPKTELPKLPRRKFSNFIRWLHSLVMGKTWTEYFVSLGFVVTILTSLFHAQTAMKARLVQRKAPPPVRFFPAASVVTDLYDGNGIDLYRLLSMETDRPSSSNVIFVMYYAPWCARSSDARWHFDNLARYFYPNMNSSIHSRTSQGAVRFVAANCWHPNGQCRQAYKLYSYPLFLAYPGTANGIYYNGIVSADYMFRFLENVISPLTRLQTVQDVLEFLHDYRTSVLAYFDYRTSIHPDGYNSFYAGSLLALERDPLRAAVKFAIITDVDIAAQWNFTHNRQVKLYRLMNETILDYPVDREYNARSICDWIFDNLANPIRWISPSTAVAGKSTALHQFITQRPTLLLFAPRQPLFDLNTHYSTLTTVALRYFNCFNSSLHHRSVNATLLKLKEWDNEWRLEKRTSNDYCLRTLRDEIRLLNDCCNDISPFIQRVQDGYQNICHYCSSGSRKLTPERTCERFLIHDDSPSTSMQMRRYLLAVFTSRSCDRLINEVLPKSSAIQYCCNQDGAGAEAFVRYVRKENQYSTMSSRRTAAHRQANCEKLRLSRLMGYVYDDGMDIENGDPLVIDGLSCRTNRTLQFAAMDRNVYGAFERKLGLSKNAAPLAVIMDDSKEATYLLEGHLNADRFSDFIANFTFNRLERFYRSENRTNTSASRSTAGTVTIHPVTSSTFQSVVMEKSQDVLLLYTSRWCAGCQRLFHVYQTLAYYFRVVNEDITFAQLDVTMNDLPWEFTVDTVPSLIFFPSDRKSDSTAFPALAPWTLPNLITFVLSHCKHETRLKFALSTCAVNSTGHGASMDSPCLVWNRYRAWKRLMRTERRIRFLKMQVESAIQFLDEPDHEWRIYLRRTWQDMSNLQIKSRALRYLLTHSLRRSNFWSMEEKTQDVS